MNAGSKPTSRLVRREIGVTRAALAPMLRSVAALWKPFTQDTAMHWFWSLFVRPRIWGVWVYTRGEGWMPGGTVESGTYSGAKQKAHRKHPGRQTRVEALDEYDDR